MNLSSAEKIQLADNFSKAAKQYDDYARLQHWAVEHVCLLLSEQLLKINNEIKPLKMLDIGCGTANIYRQLVDEYFQDVVFPWHYTGLDISAGMLAYVREKLPAAALTEQVNLVQADAEQLPFNATEFDTIISSLAVQWCDLPTVLSQAHKVLKDKGIFIFSTLLKGSLKELNQAWQVVDPEHQHINEFQTLPQLEACLKASDFNYQINDVWQTLSYPSALAVMQELKKIGANKVVNHSSQSQKLNKQKLAQLEAAYQTNTDDVNDKLASWHLAFVVLTKP